MPPSVGNSAMLRFLMVPGILVTVQLYHAFTLGGYFLETNQGHGIDTTLSQESEHRFGPLPRLKPNESFGACLMIKEDNHLLYEWLAYHFTTLPLRYVFVGSDEGNRHDPNDVLQRWTKANTGLNYWVVNATAFINRHAKPKIPSPISTNRRGNPPTEHEEAHHSFVHRQRSFITTCVESLRSKGLKWVTFIDTDEFLVMNRVGANESISVRHNKSAGGGNFHEIDPVSFHLRRSLPPVESSATVLDTIRELEPVRDLGPCYTVPRLLYGALENVTCNKAEAAVAAAKSSFYYEELSTLRFSQHARKGDFAKSKFGKVLIDISKLSNDTITRPPRNIHRPYKPECGPGAVGNFAESVFYLNHYIGSWERYASREDSRRNRDEWESRAYLTSESSCEHGVFHWFPRFLDLVGEERARYLLGVRPTLPIL